jgi:sulfite exporter TauE/SafE
MTPLDLSIPFGLGLVSSLHCTQMCGPLVLAYSLPLQGAGRSGVWAHLAYNAGRILTYSLLGALAGAAGGTLASLGHLAGLEKAASIVAGAAMILAAILMTGWLPRKMLVQLGSGPSYISRAAGTLMRSALPGHKFALGIVLGLLPCGMVYAALLKSVEAGTALAGAASMAAFGIGTAGALLAIGVFSTAITARLGRFANTFAAVSVALIGAFLLWKGITATPLTTKCPYHGNAS